MTTIRPRIPAPRTTGVLATLAVLGSLVLGAGGPARAAGAGDGTSCDTAAEAADWKVASSRVGVALSAAQDAVADGRHDEATRRLREVKRQLRGANLAAAALVGQPPTDPESDEPPGPPAVLKVSRIDHRVTTAMITLLADPRAQEVGRPVALALARATACRDTMLTVVLDARPAVLGDYADGLSDTLPDYDQELDAVSTTLAAGGLTVRGRAALEKAQLVVTTTRDAMQAEFGGGERRIP